MPKLMSSMTSFMQGEEDVKCFICTRRLRPMRWTSVLRKVVFFFALPKQYTVGFVRQMEEKEAGGRDMASLLEITTCKKCGEWCEENPLAGEMLASARLKSLEKYGE